MRIESYGDPAMEELAAARDFDELCRLLVQSPWGWGSSARHGEAVSLLCGLRGGTLPGSLVALLLCTCRRWDRVTVKLIAAVEDCGVLSGPDLDELAESLLSDQVVAAFPLAWISGQWLELGTADGTTRTVPVSARHAHAGAGRATGHSTTARMRRRGLAQAGLPLSAVQQPYS
jgi:hypothetical protein